MFDLILNPFITILALFYSLFSQNIVLSIAVFTVLVRLATSPLLLQQHRSTSKMQELQPKMKKLQEKYKGNREELSKAQMEMYREAGVNPLGGCLPLLVQLPVFLAMYQTIIHALANTPYQLIDMSGRILLPGLDNIVPIQNTWAGMDLTLPPTINPTYALILPVLVMVTQWVSYKVTVPEMPPNEDGTPNQMAQTTKTMANVMMVMFGFFSLSFSVGISIYFVVSNITGMVQYTLLGKADWGKLVGKSKVKPAIISSGSGDGKLSTASKVKSAPASVKSGGKPNSPTDVRNANPLSGAISKTEKRKNNKMRPRSQTN
jgi:YidC/Oxa1 family membrane protein insertase